MVQGIKEKREEMINMKELMIAITKKVLTKAFAKLKDMTMIERLVIIALFIIPIPFTIEGYFLIKTIIKRSVVKC